MNQIRRAVFTVKNKIDFVEKMLGPMEDFNGGKDFTASDFRGEAWRVDKHRMPSSACQLWHPNSQESSSLLYHSDNLLLLSF